LKYTLDDHGMPWFRAQVEQRCGFALANPRPYKFTSNADRYGWHRADAGDGSKPESWAYGMFIENGRIRDHGDYLLKTGLKEIAELDICDFRLTANQNIILGSVLAKDKPRVEAMLQRFGIDNERYSSVRLHSMACVALPTCALAMAESQRYLPSLISKIEELMDEAGISNEAITVRMTGCPNGCARPYIAEIGFVGKAPGVYNMYLGASFSGERLSKLYKEGVNEEQILAFLAPILFDYAQNRHHNEHFGDFTIRRGYVNPTHEGKRFHLDLGYVSPLAREETEEKSIVSPVPKSAPVLAW